MALKNLPLWLTNGQSQHLAPPPWARCKRPARLWMRRYFARLIDMLWPPGARMTGGHGNQAGFEVSAPMLRDRRNVVDCVALAQRLVPSAGKLVQLRHATH